MAEVTTLIPLHERSLHERVAATVRAETARYGIRQVQLAEVLQIKQQSVSLKLRGTTPFTLDELALIAPLLDSSVTDLLAQSEEGPRSRRSEGQEVRHQGLEPRTRWFMSGVDAEVVDLQEYRERRAVHEADTARSPQGQSA